MARTDPPVYCYQCRTNVRGTMMDHLCTRRHRRAMAPQVIRNRNGRAVYSRRAERARSAAMARTTAEREWDREAQEYRDAGEPPMAEWIGYQAAASSYALGIGPDPADDPTLGPIAAALARARAAQ